MPDTLGDEVKSALRQTQTKLSTSHGLEAHAFIGILKV
jgi:hypothetical protein